MSYYANNLQEIAELIACLTCQNHIKNLMLAQQQVYRELNIPWIKVYSDRLETEPQLIEKPIIDKLLPVLKEHQIHKPRKKLVIGPYSSIFWETSYELNFLLKMDQYFIIDLEKMEISVQELPQTKFK